jgi:hypothetical protein
MLVPTENSELTRTRQNSGQAVNPPPADTRKELTKEQL